MPVRNFYTYVLALVFVAATLVGCGGGSKPITISGSLPATGTVGVAYSGSLTAAGGNNDYTWSVTGLPAGITPSNTTSATVTIAGTPTTAGTAAVTYTVRDTKGRVQSGSASVVISAPTIAISGTLAGTGTVGTAYTGSLTASGGTAPYTWIVTGLPAGVTDSGLNSPAVTIAGTPTATGTSNVTATVTDSLGATGSYNVSIVVSAAAGIAITGSLPNTGTVGTAYTGTLMATGGTAPYTWSVTNLPAGTTVSNPTQPSITIAGTPTTAATYAFNAKVTDSLGASTNYPVHIVISGTATTACSSTPAARGNEASFNKPYAFVLSGFNDGPTMYAGSVSPNGDGTISAVGLDALSGGTAEAFTIDASTSLYTFGSDGRGCLVLSYASEAAAHRKVPAGSNKFKGGKELRRASAKSKAASAQVSAESTIVFSFSLSTAYEVGRIEEFDYDSLGLVASGQMHQQDPTSWDISKLVPNFVLGVSGYAADGEGGYLRAAIAASISNSSGVTTSLAADTNVGGNPSGVENGGTGTLLVDPIDTTTGRGTGLFSTTYQGNPLTFDFTYYIVNGGDLYVISADDLDAAGALAVSGRALASSTTTSALSGYYMLGTNGFDTDANGNVASVGTFQAPSAGNIANATLYTNDAGTYSGPTTYASATYVLDPATGRAAVTGLTGNPPVAYLTATTADDGISGFLVGTGADAESGFLFLQTQGTPAFNNGNALSSGYAFGSADDVAGANGSQVGQYNFTSDEFTSTVDLVEPFVDGVDPLQPDLTATNTYNVNADGSGTLDGANIAFVTNGTVLFGIDTKGTQPLLYIMVSQTPAE
jgi:hypothetical protein